MYKKAQYYGPPSPASALKIWIGALVLLFILVVIYFTFTRPFIFVDDYIGPRINITTANNDGQAVRHKIQNYWGYWPVIMAVDIIVLALLLSLKQDPNYPYQ